MPKLLPVAEELDGLRLNECQSSQARNGVLYLNIGIRQHVVAADPAFDPPWSQMNADKFTRKTHGKSVSIQVRGVYLIPSPDRTLDCIVEIGCARFF